MATVSNKTNNKTTDPNRTEPYEVCIKNSDKTIGYACPKCHLFCSPLIYVAKWEDALKAAYSHATSCCGDRMCSDCGANMGPTKGTNWLHCTDCREKKATEKESQLFHKAEKVTLAQYDGEWLYYADEFYNDADSLLDTFNENPPKYAWACYSLELKMNAEDIVVSYLENDHHDDSFDEVGNTMIERLQKYLDLWCKKTGVHSYLPNFKLAVLLPREEGNERG